jgi:hypothetical integral membrane protein (TIGR02206 family)
MPTTTHSLDMFAAWSIVHWLVIVATILISIALVFLRRRMGRRLDAGLAILTAIIWLTIQLVQLLSDEFSAGTSLPLHVSDLTLLAVPISLSTCSRWSRALLYCWGVALGSLAFIIPDLHDGPAKLGFWTFWVGHITIIAAVGYELAARDFRPTWRDFARAAALTTIYVVLIVPFNALTGHSYGYLGPAHATEPAVLKLFGPWPLRVIPVVITGLAAMALVTLPWPLLQSRERNRTRPGGVAERSNAPVLKTGDG